MVISLYYYLKVIKTVFMDDEAYPFERLTLPLLPRLAMAICSAGILLTGVFSWFYEHIYLLSPIFNP